MIKRFFAEPQKSFFLFGPRGTGKSTWLKQNYANAAWIDLLDPGTYRSFMARPERLNPFVRGMGKKKICIIDEIQRVPQLLTMVHKMIETFPEKQFILTGSSARKLKREGVDLLAGRAIVKKMHPFMAAELNEKFNLSKSLEEGLLPIVFSSTEKKNVLNSYINLYLEQEIMMEGIVRNIDNFSRFLEAISFSHGSVLNISEVARECEVKRTTVAGYVSVLEDLLIAAQIPVFSKRAKRKLARHKKFYFFDSGVFSALRPSGPLDDVAEKSGAALEGMVFQHLQAWLDYGGKNGKVYFWRTAGGQEVDFIIYGECGFWAIEVKNSNKIRGKELKPLRAFFEDYPQCTPIFLYRGEEILNIKGVTCLPVTSFLKNLIPNNDLI